MKGLIASALIAFAALAESSARIHDTKSQPDPVLTERTRQKRHGGPGINRKTGAAALKRATRKRRNIRVFNGGRQ